MNAAVSYSKLSAKSLDEADTRRNLFVSLVNRFEEAQKSGDQIRISDYDMALSALSELVDEEMRAYAAQLLCWVETMPPKFMNTLLHDSIEVAEPLLMYSPAVDEETLVEIAQDRPMRHLMAIAARHTVSKVLSAVVIERGDERVRAKIVLNKGASISGSSYDTLIESAKQSALITDSLTERENVPREVMQSLLKVAKKRVRAKLIQQGRRTELRTLEAAAIMAADRLGFDPWGGKYDFRTAQRKVAILYQDQRLNKMSLSKLIMDGHFAETVVAISVMGGYSMQHVKSWFAARETEPLLLCADSLGLEKKAVAKILELGPWLHSLPRDQRFKAMRSWEELKQGQKKQVLKPQSAAAPQIALSR